MYAGTANHENQHTETNQTSVNISVEFFKLVTDKGPILSMLKRLVSSVMDVIKGYNNHFFSPSHGTYGTWE